MLHLSTHQTSPPGSSRHFGHLSSCLFLSFPFTVSLCMCIVFSASFFRPLSLQRIGKYFVVIFSLPSSFLDQSLYLWIHGLHTSFRAPFGQSILRGCKKAAPFHDFSPHVTLSSRSMLQCRIEEGICPIMSLVRPEIPLTSPNDLTTAAVLSLSLTLSLSFVSIVDAESSPDPGGPGTLSTRASV